MNVLAKRLVFWAPRILCLLFAIFISLFALDVFGEGLGFWKTLLALVVHLIPTWILLIVLAVSWRREWIGAILFTALAVLYIVFFRGRFVWYVYLIMSGPLLLLGGLFLLSWNYRKEVRPARNSEADQPGSNG